MNNLVAKKSIIINATPAQVWEALVNPAMIKQYLFGTETTSDWKVGSTITYKGEWKGKKYEDKGTILQIEPEKILKSTYWSPLSGLPDTPKNYKTVTYELRPANGKTELTVSQDNNHTEEAKNQSEKNWGLVIEGIKKLLEK